MTYHYPTSEGNLQYNKWKYLKIWSGTILKPEFNFLCQLPSRPLFHTFHHSTYPPNSFKHVIFLTVRKRPVKCRYYRGFTEKFSLFWDRREALVTPSRPLFHLTDLFLSHPLAHSFIWLICSCHTLSPTLSFDWSVPATPSRPLFHLTDLFLECGNLTAMCPQRQFLLLWRGGKVKQTTYETKKKTEGTCSLRGVW